MSNDAVNFLNSAIGAKVARYGTVVTVAAIGVFAGAALSNGMMDVARHGIMTPAYFSFYDVMCVFLAVMVTDVVLLDVFNTLGMPTSTTVSLVFELLGGAFAIALIQISGGAAPCASSGPTPPPVSGRSWPRCWRPCESWASDRQKNAAAIPGSGIFFAFRGFYSPRRADRMSRFKAVPRREPR